MNACITRIAFLLFESELYLYDTGLEPHRSPSASPEKIEINSHVRQVIPYLGQRESRLTESRRANPAVSLGEERHDHRAEDDRRNSQEQGPRAPIRGFGNDDDDGRGRKQASRIPDDHPHHVYTRRGESVSHGQVGRPVRVPAPVAVEVPADPEVL